MTRESRRALDYCPETCPDVDKALDAWKSEHEEYLSDYIANKADDLIDTIKEIGTIRMRAALIEACKDIESVENERDDLQREVESLRGQVDDLKAEIRELDSEVMA